jgi:fumarate reductase (CoM/CoB) subunit A
LKKYQIIESDVLILGGGGAGLRAAISAAQQSVDVVIVEKLFPSRSGLTMMAMGGMDWPDASDPHDLQAHFNDVVRVGQNLNDENLVEVLGKEAKERGLELEKWGANILKDEEGRHATSSPNITGHSTPRSRYIPGPQIMWPMMAQLTGYDNISLLSNTFITRLLVINNRVCGAIGLDIKTGNLIVFRSKATVIATGGAGELWKLTTNGAFGLRGGAAGNGFVLAYHAGALLIDMEMIQFSPLMFYPPYCELFGNPMQVIDWSKAKLVNNKGEEFLKLPIPRDEFARKIFHEIEAGNGTERGAVIIDITTSPLSSIDIENNFEDYLGKNKWKIIKGMMGDKKLKELKIEIGPGAAHHIMGGIKINERTETNLEGLFAAGEAAASVHGANRAPGEALADIMVFGSRAGTYSASFAKRQRFFEINWESVREGQSRINSFFKQKQEPASSVYIRRKIKNNMSDYTGVVRNSKGLEKAITELAQIRKNDLPRIQVPPIKTYNIALIDALETCNMVDAAEIISRSALSRHESRGAHYMQDYPDRDDESWLVHTSVLCSDHEMIIGTTPVTRRKC